MGQVIAVGLLQAGGQVAGSRNDKCMFRGRVSRWAQQAAIRLERNPGGTQSHHPKHGLEGGIEQGMHVRSQVGGLSQAVQGAQAGDLTLIRQALESIVFWPDMLKTEELPLEVKFLEWAFG